MITDYLRSAFAIASPSLTRQEAVAAVIEQCIDEGVALPRSRLPTVRDLATALSVSASTVVAGYTLLRERGRIAGEVGRGTFVLPTRPDVEEGGVVAVQPLHWRRRAVTTATTRLTGRFGDAVDCTRGKPDATLLPTALVVSALARSSEHLNGADLGYGHPVPLPQLRNAVLPRLARDGIDPATAEMIVGSSAQQLMVMLALATARLAPSAPRVIAVEDPGYQTVFDAFEYAGFRLVGLELDEAGVTRESLETALRSGACLAVLTPRAQNPTGASWTRARRDEIATVLANYPEAIAIEDDHFAELASARPGSLLNTAAADQVVYIRSFAKALGPDLRVAVALGGPRLIQLLGEARSLLDGWTSNISQRAVAAVLSDQRLDAALEVAREAYASRRRDIIDSLGGKGLRVLGDDGLNVWIKVPNGDAANDVIERAAVNGVLLLSGQAFYVRQGRSDVIRLSVTGMTDQQASEIGKLVARAIAGGPHHFVGSIPI